jgi:gliding motility-associated-like protein
MYLNRVNPPEMRRATVLNDQYVRVEWQQLLKNKIPLERFVMVGNTLNGSNNFQKWVINANSDSLVVADKSIDVDQTNSVYKVLGIDECGDSSVFSTISKSILLNVQLNANFYPVLSWNKYLDWKEGVKEYLVERNSGQGFVTIDRLSPFDTTYTDELPSLNCMPKLDYRITAIRNKVYGLDSSWYFNSVSNIQDPGVETKVFIPNAFTPNKNELNEIFKPQGIYIFNYSMRIFNRWGEKLFDSEGCDIGWDGKYKGMIAPEGVYIYQVNVKGTDGRLYPFSGDVTLLR